MTEMVFPMHLLDFPNPGCHFGLSPAGGLGWGLGESIGLKLANPDRRVIAVVGDGSYMFGNPTPAHFVCEALGLPILTIIVNNAMWVQYEPMVEVTEDVYRRQMSIGIDAVYWGIQAVAPHMMQQASGSIINMTSPASVHGIPNGSVYAAVKGAISSLTRQCAVELGQNGIRVNAVAPGPIPTPGTMRVVDEEGWEKRLQRSPLGRLSTVEGVAQVVLFLASDASDCVNGDVLFADGGRSISAM